jgi:large conductance mechanosensitive channel
MMGLVSEFKAFIMRGNVVDLAVGVIIGAAFGALVTSFVSDVLMPPIGYLTGGVDFSEKSIDLPGTMVDPATRDKPKEEQKTIPVQIRYGKFLQKIIDFLIVAACLFVVIKAMNSVQRKQEIAPPEPTAMEKLLAEIRDELKKKSL